MSKYIDADKLIKILGIKKEDVRTPDSKVCFDEDIFNAIDNAKAEDVIPVEVVVRHKDDEYCSFCEQCKATCECKDCEAQRTNVEKWCNKATEKMVRSWKLVKEDLDEED